jgi:hypothetical protein
LIGVPTHTPPEHASVVQALPSVQVAALSSACTQPAAGEQVSLVHGLLSSQKFAATGVCTHPLGLVQVSVVQALLSLQSVGPEFTHAPLEQTFVVQASPSSQAAPSAWRP